MGAISPHPNVNGCTETPPNVQHMRLQENMDRYFASDPKTNCDKSEESNKNEKLSSEDNSQGSNSGSGNISGDTSASKCKQPSLPTSPNLVNNQTKRDAAFDFDKQTVNQGNPGTSKEYLSPTQVFCQDENGKELPICLPLTEQSLLVHNRIHWKQFQEEYLKKKSSLGKRSTKSGSKSTSKKMKTGQVECSGEGEQNGAKGSMAAGSPFSAVNAGALVPIPFSVPVMLVGSSPHCQKYTFPWPYNSALTLGQNQAMGPNPQLDSFAQSAYEIIKLGLQKSLLISKTLENLKRASQQDKDCGRDDPAKGESFAYQIPNLEETLKRERERLGYMSLPELVSQQLLKLQEESNCN